MSNKPSNLHQHSYAIMIKSDNEAYQQMDINEEENMSDSDYDRGNFLYIIYIQLSNIEFRQEFTYP